MYSRKDENKAKEAGNGPSLKKNSKPVLKFNWPRIESQLRKVFKFFLGSCSGYSAKVLKDTSSDVALFHPKCSTFKKEVLHL